MKRTGILWAVFFFWLGQLYAQEERRYPSFEEVAERRWNEIKDITEFSEGDEVHEYYRWQWFWQTRQASPDKIMKELEYLIEYPICTGNVPVVSSWKLVGPLKDLKACGTMGIVVSLATDPQNPNIVYVGTRHSGLWRGDFSQNPVQWSCLTDNLRLPGLGIRWIAVDPQNPNTIYAATGSAGYLNGGFTAYGFGVGLLRSFDGGSTWKVLGTSAMKSYGEQIVQKVLVNPQNPNTIYIMTYKHIFRSYDRGDTWEMVFEAPTYAPNDNVFTIFTDMEMLPGDPNAVYVSTRMGGYYSLTKIYDFNCAGENLFPHKGAPVFYTLDGGQNWQELQLGDLNEPQYFRGSHSHYVVLAVSPSTPNLIFTAYNGITQMEIKYNCPLCPGTPIVTCKPTWKTIIEAYQKNGTQVKRTISNSPLLNINHLSPHSFQISPTDTNVIYCEVGRSLFSNGRVVAKSTNGGKMFHEKSTYNGTLHADQRVIQVIAGSPFGTEGASDKVLVGNDGGVAFSENGGNSWQIKNGKGLAITEFNSVRHAWNTGDLFAGGTQDNAVFIYDKGEWRHPHYRIIGDGAGALFDMENDDYCYAQIYGWRSGPGFPFVRSSAPFTGNLIDRPLPELGFFNAPMQEAGGNFYVGLKRVWKVSQAALRTYFWTSFTSISGVLAPGDRNYIRSLSVCESNPDVIFAANGRHEWGSAANSIIFRTTDGGNTWQDITQNIWNSSLGLIGYTPIASILVNPENPNEVWVGMGNYRSDANKQPPYYGKNRVLHSTDGGNTWEDYSDNLPAFPVNDIVYEKGTGAGDLYVATDAGIFYTNKKLYKTHGWVCFSSGLPICLVTDLDIDYHSGKIRAATYGRGIWESPLACPSQFDIYHTGQIPADLYEARYGIYSNGTILPGKTIYRAGYEIVLSDGFVADGSQGVDFHAYIRPCGDFPPDILKDSYVSVQKVSYEKQKNKGTSSLKIYPNPTSDKFTIEIPEEGCYEIQVQNLVGQTILQEKTCESKTEISMQRFPSGIYFVKVSGEKSYFGKIVKQ